MNHTLIETPPEQVVADGLIVTAYEGPQWSPAAARLDEVTQGALTRLAKWESFEGKAGQCMTLAAPHGVTAGAVVVCGLGSADELNRGVVYRGFAAGARRLSDQEHPTSACFTPGDWPAELQESAVAGVIMGCQGQDLYRVERKRHPFADVLWSGLDEAAVDAGRTLGESVNFTRRLVNEPPSTMNPMAVAEEAERMAAAVGLEIEVWDQQRLEAERCGSMLAVARGSSCPPRLVILRHRGGRDGDETLGLVGKGVTFDSGGLSLKPSESMKLMKCDMAGAATVLGAMQAIARLKLPVNVIGLVGLVENMVSGDSYKLGDVLTARNGRTIEVLNTDAEGRLVLADVLDVARSEGATRLVDLATLTGACVVALGMDVAGLMSNSDEWCGAVQTAADTCGEAAWPLPMFSEFAEQIKSQVADIKNVGEGRWGGAITAAKFLEEFVGDTAWTHIDIAGPAFVESTKPWIDGGGSGAFVRTLVELARRWPG